MSNRRVLLMLIELEKRSAIKPEIDIVTTGELFSILSRCVRKTDHVGWYREGRVTAAVLTQQGEPDREQLADLVAGA